MILWTETITCPECKGSGYLIPDVKWCPRCKGNFYVLCTKKEYFQILPNNTDEEWKQELWRRNHND